MTNVQVLRFVMNCRNMYKNTTDLAELNDNYGEIHPIQKRKISAVCIAIINRPTVDIRGILTCGNLAPEFRSQASWIDDKRPLRVRTACIPQ